MVELPSDEEFGARFRLARQAAGKTAEDIAKILNRCPQAVRNRERGVTPWKLIELRALNQHLDVVALLLGGQEFDPPKPPTIDEGKDFQGNQGVLASLERVGLRLRRFRRALMVSIPKFGEMMGVSKTTVWHRECGRREVNYSELQALDPILRKNFAVTVLDLLDEGSDFELQVPLPSTSLRNLGKPRKYRGRLRPPPSFILGAIQD